MTHPNSNPRERICKHCGKTFLARWPSEDRRFCSPTCHSAGMTTSKMVTRECPNCGRRFTRKDWEMARVTCCSLKCGKQYAARTQVGENHPLWKPKVTMHCEVCGQPREVKPSLVSRFRACSGKCRAILSARAQIRRKTSRLETIMAAMFADAGLDFVRQRPFWRYRADFAFEDAKLVVECDGDYWHSRPDVQRSDRRKDAYLQERGWRILRLTETDILASPGECTERVLHAIDPQLETMRA